MSERVEWVEATDPISVVLPGDSWPDGSTAGPNEYGILIWGGGAATIAIKGDPAGFAAFAADVALQSAGFWERHSHL